MALIPGAGGCTGAHDIRHRALAVDMRGPVTMLVAPGLCPILGVPGTSLGRLPGVTPLSGGARGALSPELLSRRS